MEAEADVEEAAGAAAEDIAFKSKILRQLIRASMAFAGDMLPDDFGDVTKLKQCPKFKTCLFKNFYAYGKYVLTTFDQEDFERLFLKQKIVEECDDLQAALKDTKKSDLVKRFADKEISLDKFPSLTEVDIGAILKWNLNGLSRRVFGWDTVLEIRDGCIDFSGESFHYIPNFSKAAKKLLKKKYTPLKDEWRLHLILEHVTGKCRCLSDMLIAQAVHDSGIFELIDGEERETLRDHWIVFAFFMASLMNCVYKRRCKALRRYASFIIAPLRHGYGPCDESVVELVIVAEARRRFENHRFISKWHILWAIINFTKIGSFVKKLVDDSGLMKSSSPEKPAKYPKYNIYRKAREWADMLSRKPNNQGVVAVGVEHLSLACVFKRSQGGLCKETTKATRRGDQDLVDCGTEWITNVCKLVCVQEFCTCVRQCRSHLDEIVHWRWLEEEKMESPKIDFGKDHDHFLDELNSVRSLSYNPYDLQGAGDLSRSKSRALMML